MAHQKPCGYTRVAEHIYRKCTVTLGDAFSVLLSILFPNIGICETVYHTKDDASSFNQSVE